MSNFNLVLRTYIAMRQMTADDLALLGTLRALNDTDREKLIEAMSDKPTKKSTKKPTGKGGGGKSARASGMAEQLNKSLQGQRKATGDDDSGFDRQAAVDDITGRDGEHECGKCGGFPDSNVHHKQTDPNYHEFVAGKSDAQSAAGGS